MKSRLDFKPTHTRLTTKEDLQILLEQNLEYLLSDRVDPMIVKNVHNALKFKLDMEKATAQVAIAIGKKPSNAAWFFDDTKGIGDASEIKQKEISNR